MDFRNKKAVVFGGSSGIGLATANSLSTFGAEVTAVSRTPPTNGESNNKINFRKCDVLDRGAVADLFSSVGPIDYLVSAATGGKRVVGPFSEMDLDGYAASFDKLWGYANVVRLGLEYLPDNGAIVLVSGSPARRAKQGLSALASVGSAVEALARSIAGEIAPKRINVVSPGIIDTPQMVATGAARSALIESLTGENFIPRAGTADEVAQAVVFALHNEFVTGTVVDVDGGWMAG